MYNDLANYDMTKFSQKFIAQVRQMRKLLDVPTEYECRGASSVTVPIFSGGQATPHVPGTSIPDFGGGAKKAVIETEDWDAGTHLDYFLLDKNNFSYEKVVEKSLIPAAVCERMDQIVINALNKANDVRSIGGENTDILRLISDVRAMLDRDKLFIPQEDRFLILPADCEPLFFNDDKMMSNNFVQLQMNNISEGKIGRILGFKLAFVNDMKSGGLPHQVIEDGASLLWTCYATSKVSVASAIGYGANRSSDGTGGIFKMQDEASKGGYFINAPFSYGAKVVLPNGVVRFTVKTRNYQSVA
jgi:hypothetical protein